MCCAVFPGRLPGRPNQLSRRYGTEENGDGGGGSGRMATNYSVAEGNDDDNKQLQTSSYVKIDSKKYIPMCVYRVIVVMQLPLSDECVKNNNTKYACASVDSRRFSTFILYFYHRENYIRKIDTL